MVKVLVVLSVFMVVGCYKEPSGLKWTKDTVTSKGLVSLKGVTVLSDTEIYPGAVEANLDQALDAIASLGYDRDVLELIFTTWTIRINPEECLSGYAQAEGDRGGCFYAHSTWDGDSDNWTVAETQSNAKGLQFAHELLHLVMGWYNIGGNADHSAWSSRDWDVVDTAAENAYIVSVQ